MYEFFKIDFFNTKLLIYLFYVCLIDFRMHLTHENHASPFYVGKVEYFYLRQTSYTLNKMAIIMPIIYIELYYPVIIIVIAEIFGETATGIIRIVSY
ncbi:MAG: hypothetical protein IIA61_12750 [Candidatus Marinimicrobia bacterium]|nr:hypothetical protein [Candidatus Neomarinimicrobiota bacterium]